MKLAEEAGALWEQVAEAMTATAVTPNSDVPAGYTFLSQFLAHDMSFDRTSLVLGENVTVEELVQGRSPALDLDSLYGRGPGNVEDAKFYSDGVRLKMGTTTAVRSEPIFFRLSDEFTDLAPLVRATPTPGINVDLDGFDLPRIGLGSRKSERRKALISDPRNDENLAVAQTHLAFIRFHNRVVDHLVEKGTPSVDLFNAARETVVMHYQWMIRHDFLPRIVEEEIVDRVFANGRRFFEVSPPPGSMPTMPIEFAVAAGRFGHSMVGPAYQWNRVFRANGLRPAWLRLLFRFSGMSGTLSPLTEALPPARDANRDDPEDGDFERLPTNWIVDWRRLYDFREARREDLWIGKDKFEFNFAKRIDTLLTDSLRELPLGALAGDFRTPLKRKRNLVFRTLSRGQMINLASGQQMLEFMNNQIRTQGPAGKQISPLGPDEILNGRSDIEGVRFGSLDLKDDFARRTPLWFYILREAELNGGKLTGVGGNIVAEVFHRAMEGSRYSIIRNPFWQPSLGPANNRDSFRMVDLLLFAFEGRAELLHPLDFLGR